MGSIMVNQFPSGPAPIFYPKQRGPSPIEQLAMLNQINRVDPGQYEQNIANTQQKTAMFTALLSAMLQQRNLEAQRSENALDRVDLRDRLDKGMALTREQMKDTATESNRRWDYMLSQMKANMGESEAARRESGRQFDAMNNRQVRTDEMLSNYQNFAMRQGIKQDVSSALQQRGDADLSREERKANVSEKLADIKIGSGAEVINNVPVPAKAMESLVAGETLTYDKIAPIISYAGSVTRELDKLKDMTPEERVGAISAAKKVHTTLRGIVPNDQIGLLSTGWFETRNNVKSRVTGAVDALGAAIAKYPKEASEATFRAKLIEDAAARMDEKYDMTAENLAQGQRFIGDYLSRNPKAPPDELSAALSKFLATMSPIRRVGDRSYAPVYDPSKGDFVP